MSTATARLGLTKPAPADSMATGADQLSVNYNKIDSAMGAYINAAAPAGFTGCLWDNTNTNERNVFDGAAWQPIQGDTWTKEQANYDLDGTPRSTTGEILILNETLNAINGKAYLIRWQTFLKWTNAQNGSYFQLNFKVNGVTFHSRAYGDDGGVFNSNIMGIDVMGTYEYVSGSTGVQTIGMYVKSSLAVSNFAANVNGSNAVSAFSIEKWAG